MRSRSSAVLLPLLFLLTAAAPADLRQWQKQAERVTITRDDWGIAHVRGKWRSGDARGEVPVFLRGSLLAASAAGLGETESTQRSVDVGAMPTATFALGELELELRGLAGVELFRGPLHGERTRGEGDAERNRIFADAYGGERADFFAFYRSMQAYEQGMRPGDTRMLLAPDSEFFRYFANPLGSDPAPSGGQAKR